MFGVEDISNIFFIIRNIMICGSTYIWEYLFTSITSYHLLGTNKSAFDSKSSTAV